MARPTHKQATDFGLRLSQARKALNMTQTEMAKRLGVSQQMIDYYERRSINPMTSFVRKAATVLHISVDDLLGHSQKKNRKTGPPSLVEQRLGAVKKLPREKQKVVLQLLDSFLQTNETVSNGHSNGH